ncbi:hypothetical protein BMS3Abin15_00821 [bacterium BMS3Abin15]|nr:hypothetical protein BMS3Abin15_00821 [bacterium BMS3Abin15]
MDKRIPSIIVIGIVVTMAVVVGLLFFSGNQEEKTTKQIQNLTETKDIKQKQKSITACPEDAKICSDGSSVGRIGPDCEFTECPKAEEKNDVEMQGADNENDSKTIIAAGILLDTENISDHPQNAYAWALLNLLPQWDSWWKMNSAVLRNRYLGVRIIGYHTGAIIKRSFISEYDKLAQYVDSEAKWIDMYYLKDTSGRMINFDDGDDLYYIDIRNTDARIYMSKVAQGIMGRYNHLVGQSLDGIFLDHVEWKPRQNAQAVIDENSYRQAMLTFFEEIRAAIRIENDNSELGGNAGAIRDHGDYFLLKNLDTVLSETAFVSPLGDSYSDLLNYLEELKNSSNQQTLIIGIYGDSYRQAMLTFFEEIRDTMRGAIRDHGDNYLLESLDTVLTENAFVSLFGIDVDNNGCPNEQKWQDAISLAEVYSNNVLISADYGPAMHGNLDCYREVLN